MWARWRLFSVAGVPVSFHWTCFPVAIVWAIWAVPEYQWRPWASVELAGLFLIVLLHELGHAVVGRWMGCTASEIILSPLGGLAKIEGARRWNADLLITMAGPGANVVLLLISVWLYWKVGPRYPGDIALAIERLTFANLGMLVLNLLPIWPLDGGRMLQAVAGRCLGAVRGWLLTGTLGLTLALGGSAWLAYRDQTILSASIAPLIFFLLPNVFWAIGMLMAERRRGINRAARCPWCGTHPLDGATGPCTQCGETCNLLTDTRDCWNCGATDGEITCRYCGGTADVRKWSNGAAAA